MRLDKKELSALRNAVRDLDDEVYLFGFRVEDTKKGSDIDVLIFSQKNAFKLSQEVTVRFFMECEEKIDVIVMDKNNLTEEQRAFLNVIKMERFQ